MQMVAKDVAKRYVKNKIRKKVIAFILVLIKPFIVPIILISIVLMLICYITDIFYLGIKNEDKSGMKNEVKYYTAKTYTDEDSKSFFESVGEFISNLFSKEVIADAEWPVIGSTTISSPFGYRNAPTAGASTFHSGIDIAAPEGSKLVAITEGTVSFTGWNGAGGYTIIIIAEEYTFTYCHCAEKFNVKVGDKVEKGQVIGKVGPKNVYGIENNPYTDSEGRPTNGATTGCHCHFAVRKDGELIDPLTILKGGILA